MASAWGDSWGAAWGNSWGSIDTDTPEVEAPKFGGGGITGRQRRLLKQIEQEDEIVAAVIAAFIQLRE